MSNKNKIVWLLVILGLLFRFAFVFLHPFPDKNDAYQYDLIATNIINGHGISTETEPPYLPQIDRVPFYPIFMSLFYLIFGHHLTVIRIVQAILSMLTAFFVYLVAKEIVNSDERLQTLPIISFGLTMLCPFLIFFVSILFTETLNAFLVTLSILLFIYGIKRKKLYFYSYSGFIIGLAFMTRPEAFAFPILLASVFLFNNRHNLRRSTCAIALYLLPFFMIWGIWVARNYFAFDRFIPITAQDGPLLLVGTYPPNRYEKDFPEEIREEYLKVRFITEKERINVISDMKRRAFQRILNHPLQYAGYCFQRIPILWVNSYTTYVGIDDTFGDLFKDISKNRKNFVIKIRLILLKASLYLINVTYVVLGIFGIIFLIKKWPTIYPLYIIPIYFTLIHLPLGDTSPRYVIKILPLFFIFSSAGLMYGYYKIYPISISLKSLIINIFRCYNIDKKRKEHPPDQHFYKVIDKA